MSYEDWTQIYEQMKAVFQRDKELTHIDISINIQPVKSEKKTAKNHNGVYVKIMDWVKGETINFVDIVLKK